MCLFCNSTEDIVHVQSYLSAAQSRHKTDALGEFPNMLDWLFTIPIVKVVILTSLAKVWNKIPAPSYGSENSHMFGLEEEQ